MNRRAFTLVELSVTVAIILVALGLVVVRIDGWTARHGLNASARVLGNTIRTYREKALLEERTYTVLIDVRSGTYEVRARSAGAAGPVCVRRLGEGRSFETVRIGAVPREGVASLRFDARGVLPEVEIVLRAQSGEGITLRPGTVLNEVEYEETP